MGSVYKRGEVYWIKFYRDGKPYRESAASKLKRDALRLLRKREGTVALGTFTGLKPEKTSFDDLASDLPNDYRNNARKSLSMVEYYVERLRRHFGGRKAVHITTDQIRSYIAARREEISRAGRLPANSTINRELSALKRMFNLGRQAGKVVQLPYIPMLSENNVRKAYHHRDYIRLREALPARLRPVLVLAYYTGMRKSEILGLLWSQVDFQARVIRLEPGTTKNDEARIVPLTGELYHEMKAQRKLRDAQFLFCQRVFFDHSTGKPIKDFRGSWETACKRIGLPNAIFHDLHRTGVRNLIRAGVPERVAMAISGHKTRSVFDRYNIVDEDDVKAAGKAVESYLEQSTQDTRSQVAELDQARAQIGRSRAQFGHNRAKSPHSAKEPIALSR